MRVNNKVQIDLWKLIRYLLKRCWIMIILAVIGFGAMYYYTEKTSYDTYTAYGTLYVNNNNPNTTNYQYTSSADLATAVQLLDTYMVVIKSNKVMDAVAEQLEYNIPSAYIAKTLSMGSVNDTGVMRVFCTTTDPHLSMDICNAVMDVAPAEIIRVVGAGSCEVIDYATLPELANEHGAMKKGVLAAMVGAVLGACVLIVVFLLDQRVTQEKDLTDNYTPPLLATVLRMDEKSKGRKKKRKKKGRLHDPDAMGNYLINEDTSEIITENYKHLRTNLRFAVIKQDSKVIVVTSAVPGEGKSTVSANIAIVSAMNNQKVLLIDADMRKPRQHILFGLDSHDQGLSTALVGAVAVGDAIRYNVRENLDIMPAGIVPPNPSELLNSPAMDQMLAGLSMNYDLIIMDTPPVNVVTDALVRSDKIAGLLFVVRQNYSEQREIRRALESIELTNAEMLGFVYSAVELSKGGYYYRHYYHKYYNKYYKEYQHEPGKE